MLSQENDCILCLGQFWEERQKQQQKAEARADTRGHWDNVIFPTTAGRILFLPYKG